MYSTYCRLNVHVSASWREVVRVTSNNIIKEARFSRTHRQLRHARYREMLHYHNKEQKLVRYWRM